MDYEVARIKDIELRLRNLEEDQIKTNSNADFAKEKFTELSKKVDNIQAGISRLIWTGGGLIILAVGNFILKGGLVNVVGN